MADERFQVGGLDLERIVEPDAAFQRFHADIRDADIVAHQEGMDSEAVGELVDGLDEDWHYLDTMCVVTGKVYTSEGKELLLNEQRLVSLGAGVMEKDGKRKLCHYLGVMSEGVIVDTLLLDPDEEKSVDIKPAIQKDDEAAQAMAYHYPDLKADLDIALLNSDSVVEATKALKGFLFDHDPDKVDPNEFRAMVEAYLNKLLNFNDSVPYSVAFKGIYFSAQADEEGSGVFRRKKAADWQRRVARPSGILLVSVPALKGDTSGENDTESVAALLFTGADPYVEGDEEDMMIVPISDSYFKLESNMERVRAGFDDLELE